MSHVVEPAPMTRWRAVAYLFAAALALGLGYFIFSMPLQVSDNVTHILRVQQLTVAEVFASELRPGSVYLRPMMMLTINALFELANGHYFLAFKLFHVLQLVALLLMFVRMLRVQTAWDAAVSALAVVAVIGMHTFFGTLYEGYPINTYMSILVYCMLALNLSFGRPAPWRDALAVLVFVVALFTVETGVLVVVCLAVGYAVGFRGVSARGLAACAAVLIGYGVLRFGLLSGTLPGLDERSSGFGFRAYAPSELNRVFGPHRLLFSLYNVVCSVLTVFFAEPRAGVWRFVRDVSQREQPVEPALVLNVFTSTLSSFFIFVFVWTRRRHWLARRFEHCDRLVLVFLAVVLGNAVMSFPYTKDVIVSPAGLLYPLALFAAIRDVPLRRDQGPGGTLFRKAGPWLLALLSLGWTLRASSVPYGLWYTAYKYQRQWIHIDEWLVAQKLEYNTAQLQLLGQLRSEALQMPVPNRHELGRWGRWGQWTFDLP